MKIELAGDWLVRLYWLRMSSPYQSPAGLQPPNRRRKWPLVLSGCAVAGFATVVACGGLLYFGFRQVTGEGEVAVEVDRLFQGIAEGRAAGFYRTRGSAELKHATTEKQFVEFSQMINERLGKLRSKTATGFSVQSKNLATHVDAVYDCQFAHGHASVKTRFKSENGQWMLQTFHVDSPKLVKGPMREKCPSCGQFYEVGAKFCPHCGEKLSNDSAADNSEPKSGAGSEEPPSD
jgi:hypothetical protein